MRVSGPSFGAGSDGRAAAGVPSAPAAVWFAGCLSRGAFVRGRYSFDLPEVPASAVYAAITFTGHYRLFVNNRPVGRGPASSGWSLMKYDIWEVSGLLRPGRNTLAVELVYYGYAVSSFPEAREPAFWCELDIEAGLPGARPGWRWSLNPAYEQGARRRNICYGPMETFDARADEPWRETGYDDSGWASSQPAKVPWAGLAPRGIAHPRQVSLLPGRVARVAEVPAQEYSPQMHGGLIDNIATYLALDVPQEPTNTRIENVEDLLSPAPGRAAVVHQPSPADPAAELQNCATVIVDFGREVTGYGWIDVTGNEGAVIDIAYGERLTGGRVPPVVQSCGYADRYILREGRQRHEVYDWKGYRYAQLTFRELTRPLQVHSVGTTFTAYPVERRGDFRASDSMAADLWHVGAYTQQLCMHDRLMDTPWREQAEWLGDGRIQLLTMQNAFGEAALGRNFLQNMAESQLDDGRIPAVSFQPVVFSDYSLFWAVGVADALRFDGDLTFAASMLPHLDRLFAWFDRHLNPDGLLEDVPDAFIDWANVGRGGVCAPMNAIYRLALLAAAEVGLACGDPTRADGWQDRADRVRDAFHNAFWDDAAGYYRDNVVDGLPQERYSQHTQSMAVLAGVAQGESRALMARTIADPGLVQTEPYFSYYLCEALAEAGEAATALDFLHRRWGRMLESGATTFWEEWSLGGTFRSGRWLPRPRSHCHAWSAAPTAWLSRHVLGVRIERASGPVIIQPNPCGMAHASGAVPTAYGTIEVSWTCADGVLDVKVTAPDGAPLDVRAPREDPRLECLVSVNGTPLRGGIRA